jgi:hypothetical protein
MKRKFFTFIAAALTALILFTPGTSSALSGSEFNAGRIIDDAVFFNPGGMDVNTIQNFLNSKVPVCDTNGTKPYGSTTRAAHGTSRGYPPPYVCLKDYRMDTPSKPAEAGLCGAYNGGNRSAAQIIYDVAQICGINPKVMLVLLQKEQSLVTDDWPWSNQYRSATGYGCPDTAPCDAEYYGFFNQVYHGARQFKRYARDANVFGYRSGRVNYIQYNPVASCGGTNIFIQNQATAGLYNYTPYQPNAPALNNLYGTGDSCSAYGNRNFWRMFNDWFGSTLTDCPLIDVTGRVYRLYNPNKRDFLYTTNSTEICLAEGLYGYHRDGYAFKTTDSSAGGAKPVYRFSTPSGTHFYTINETERAYVQSIGFGYEGVAYYAQPNNTPYYSPVFRLRGQFGQHFYTNSESERDYFLTKLSYVNEGIVFYAPNNVDSTANIYRLLKPNNHHFYTSSTLEKDYLVTYAGFRMESIEFKGLHESNGLTLPVYRLVGGGKHFITSSPGERDFLARNGFRNEGIVFYIPSAEANWANPAYRLYRKTDGDHIYTASSVERSVLQGSPAYIYEGVPFRGFP